MLQTTDYRNKGLENIDESWRIGDDKEDVEKFLFFLHINYDREELTQAENPLKPRDIETRFNDLVFRSRHVEPVREAGEKFILPLETFEVSYELSKNFKDKQLLHEAIESSLVKRSEAQYSEQKRLVKSRVLNKE